MSLPVIVIVTSVQCGHCVSMRGADGSLKSDDAPISIPSKWAWNEKFFLNLLRGGEQSGPAKFKVFEINYKIMNPSPDNIKEISEFSIGNSNRIKRVIYNNIDDNLQTNTVIEDKNTISPSSNIKFKDFVSRNIPAEISNYIVFFPSILYFSNESWEKSKLNTESLYGLIGGANVKYNNGKWGFDSSIQPTRIDPVEMSSKIVKGQISLKPEVVLTNDGSNKVIARAGCSAQKYNIYPM